MVLPGSALGPVVGPVHGAFGVLYLATTALASETASARASEGVSISAANSPASGNVSG